MQQENGAGAGADRYSKLPRARLGRRPCCPRQPLGTPTPGRQGTCLSGATSRRNFCCPRRLVGAHNVAALPRCWPFPQVLKVEKNERLPLFLISRFRHLSPSLGNNGFQPPPPRPLGCWLGRYASLPCRVLSMSWGGKVACVQKGWLGLVCVMQSSQIAIFLRRSCSVTCWSEIDNGRGAVPARWSSRGQ